MHTFKETLEEILDEVLEQQRSTYDNQLVSFDQHKKQVKLQSLELYEESKKRLTHGYAVLIETIEAHNLHKS